MAKSAPIAKIPVADIRVARAMINHEIDGLKALSGLLDASFVRAVDTIHDMRAAKRGRLIVAGVGKSGHVANKMVATFASTGVPAHYVHPAEASHGDLGMIAEGDVVILISVSGESKEQNDLITYTRRFAIPLIAITRVADSTLGKAADIVLCLPDTREAFAEVVAPTTSAVATMAMGDALAEALMHRIGLTPEQFRVFHPGGKLGQQLLKVSDLMITGKDLPIVAPTAMMDKAIVMMTQKNVGCVIIADGAKNLKGIITDGDLKRHMKPDLLRVRVDKIMGKKPLTIAPDLLAAEAVNQMLRRKNGAVTSLVVVEGGKLVGLIRVQECLQAGLI
jgi:arabinose-5-phosphate isomerase